jgi:hypothetical protein
VSNFLDELKADVEKYLATAEAEGYHLIAGLLRALQHLIGTAPAPQPVSAAPAKPNDTGGGSGPPP